MERRPHCCDAPYYQVWCPHIGGDAPSQGRVIPYSPSLDKGLPSSPLHPQGRQGSISTTFREHSAGSFQGRQDFPVPRRQGSWRICRVCRVKSSGRELQQRTVPSKDVSSLHPMPSSGTAPPRRLSSPRGSQPVLPPFVHSHTSLGWCSLNLLTHNCLAP